MSKTQKTLSVAIVGAGMGGLTAAATLRRAGIDVRIYEQARRFARLGAGIQQTPNSVKVLRALGLEERLRAIAFQPASTQYCDSRTGEVLQDNPQGQEFEARFGAPHLLLHRGDLHEALASLVPADIIERGKKLTGIAQDADGVTMSFADGTDAHADVLIGADGVHSVVREWMLGPERPTFTGRVAYRTVFPASLLGGLELGDSIKWVGPDRHIVIYYTNPQRSEVYFVTSTPEPDFDIESWSTEGDMDVLRAAYADFHPDVRRVLAACPGAHKWALVERKPLPRWTEGRVALLGDACHPMTPYMAQGAAQSIEDAAVLARCLEGVGPDGAAHALKVYEANRLPRTGHIQTTSRLNDYVLFRKEQDKLYGYSAWDEPLVDVVNDPASVRSDTAPASAAH